MMGGYINYMFVGFLKEKYPQINRKTNIVEGNFYHEVVIVELVPMEIYSFTAVKQGGFFKRVFNAITNYTELNKTNEVKEVKRHLKLEELKVCETATPRPVVLSSAYDNHTDTLYIDSKVNIIINLSELE